MRAASPSVMVKVTLTRLRSIGVTVVTTSAPYRLRDRYWRLISCSARSTSALSKGRPSPMPASRSDFSSTSCSNSFRPTKDDGGDDRALVDDDDHDLVLDLDAHVLEQAGGEQRAQRGGALLVGVGVADAKRQRAEHRARVGALQALDADVLDHEGLHRPRRGRIAAPPPAPGKQPRGAAHTWQGSTGTQEAWGRLSAGPAGGPHR